MEVKAPKQLSNNRLRKQWWEGLDPQWQKAFLSVFFQSENTPSDEDLLRLATVSVLRFAGPKAFYPNMNLELSNLSGIQELTNLEILVATNHELTGIKEVGKLRKLKSLFLTDNSITSLEGIEDLLNLEQLYVNGNKLQSIAQVEKLVHLKELILEGNELSELAGITENHKSLPRIQCARNKIPFKEVMRIQNNFYIEVKN